MPDTSATPGRVTFLNGHGDLPKLHISTPWSEAEIYRQGAHVTHFQRRNEPPLLFMSGASRFLLNTPIRGGIPLIFPWFGAKEGFPQHGFARTQTWDVQAVVAQPNGEVAVTFRLPESAEAATLPKFTAEYIVTVGATLAAELVVTNLSAENFTFENCLHTYFAVGSIHDVTVSGLKDTAYLDKVSGFSRKQETSDAIKITGETDRVYLDTKATVTIHDAKWNRRILVEKSGSDATVLWNPWITKSQQMADFGDEEYPQMVCVESGNMAENKLTLASEKTARLKVVLKTENV